MKRYILTGTPGAGKTSILRRLAESGFGVVEEAATEVIASRQARGEAEPWTTSAFTEEVVALQRKRQLQAADGPGIQFYDRSPVCTHALARYLGRPVGPDLVAELDRVVSEGVYERQVFFVRNLGFCEPTAARRISFEESLIFERVHEESYRAFGFELVDIPAGSLAERISAIHTALPRIG